LSAYDLDAKQVGTIKPPDDLTRYLGEKQWFLRDSNWSPNFPTAATQISWFIEKTAGKKVDGVIGLNAYVLQDLIKATGPLDVPEYNEVITDKNIMERLEFHSEVSFTPGQTKQEYSVLLFSKVLAKLNTLKADKISSFLAAMNHGFETQQLAVFLNEPAEQSIVHNLGWTGSLVSPQCPVQLSTENCIVDTIAQVEANVGINKANYHLERSINHTVSIKPGQANHTRVVTLKNTASSNSWPKGPYKAYIRFYLSPEDQLGIVKINNAILPAEQISQQMENDKRVIGVMTETLIQQTTTLEITYSRPLSTQKDFSYVFFDQKQAGIPDRNMKVMFSHSPDLQPVVIAPQAKVAGQNIVFDDMGTSHSFVGVQFK
jgi:hypothetical protein